MISLLLPTNKNTITYILLFCLYVGCAFVFSAFSPQAQIVSLWPSAGVALAGCLVLGYRFLVGVFLGSCFFNLTTHFFNDEVQNLAPIIPAALIALGSTIQAWANTALLRRLRVSLLSAPSYYQVSTFILIGLLCCLISAVVGNAVLVFTHESVAIGMLQWFNVLVWWVGDFLGVIFVTPLILGCLQCRQGYLGKGSLLKGLAVPLLSILVIFQAAQQYIEHLVVTYTQNEFELKAKVAENSLKYQMSAYLYALQQLGSELSERDSINKDDFYDLVKRLSTDLPGIRAMSWNPVIKQRDLAMFEQVAREELGSDFQIKGAPLYPEDPLVVVKFIEPLAENKAAQGFNVYSNASRRESMLLAKKTHSAVSTDIIQLVQSDQREPGFLIFTPVFQNVDPMEQAIDSHESLKGFAVGVFLVAEIINKSLSDDLINFLDIYIHEKGRPEKAVYGNKSIIAAMSQGDGLGYIFEIAFAGRTWVFNLHIDQQYLISLQVEKSLSFLATQWLFGTLAAFIILSAFGRHVHLRELVKERTKEIEKINMQLEYYAFYDALTGLPNRRLFFDRAEHSLKLASRNKYTLALIFLDLNEFKVVNDTLGHESGDRLLVEVSQRFRSTLRASDTLARMGGDEFTLLIDDNPQPEDICTLVEKLTQCLQRPVVLDDCEHYVSASVGVALYPDDGDSIEDLLRKADMAMYKEKRASVCI